uniref:Uncharacterized protein n=1 Tax=viral metagenome TaxID=1070528 RepID=A0A6C0CRA4_9ZZZZ
MKCSPKMMRYTGYLHIIALIVAIYGTFHQIDAVKSGKPFSPALAIALTLMLILRVPNQVCVAFKESHGWYSVIGTVVGALSFAYLAYNEYTQATKVNPHSKKHLSS